MEQSIWRNPRVWIGLTISVAAVLMVIYRVDLADVRDAFAQADYIWLGPGVFFAILSFFLRAVRWQALFHPLWFSLSRLFWIMSIGYTVTTVLPLRLGDLVRAHLIGEIEEESKARAFTTVAVEHLLDVLSVLVILLALTPFVPLPGWVRTTMFIATGIVVASVLLIGVTRYRRQESLRFVSRTLRKLPERWSSHIRQTIDSAIDGFSALGSPLASLKAAGWSAGQWLAGGLMMWAVLRAFDLPASFTVAMFMVAMSAMALAIPSSPGFVGVYHAVLIEALVGVFGASYGEATSFAVISHLLLFAPPVVFGAIVILRDPSMWDRLLRWRSGGSHQPRENTGETNATD